MFKCYQGNVTIDNLGDQFYDSTIIFGTLDLKKFGCSLMKKCSPLWGSIKQTCKLYNSSMIFAFPFITTTLLVFFNFDYDFFVAWKITIYIPLAII
jgi:cell division protein FtsW (lipid II flippase)